MIIQYAEVILPLPLKQTFTYRIPEGMPLMPGARVLVPFGVRKYYAGIVDCIHAQKPDGFVVKDIAEVLDSIPILLPVQLKLWHWIADYYMCTLGEVFKAALPSGMKLESEMVVTWQGISVPGCMEDERMQTLCRILSDKGELSLAQLEKRIKDFPVLPVVKSLLEQRIVSVHESVRSGYRPHMETWVTLSEDYAAPEALHHQLEQLKRARKQYALLSYFLAESGWASAIEDGVPDASGMLRTELLHYGGISALTALLKKGILRTFQKETERLQTCDLPVTQPADLSKEQTRAYQEITKCFNEKQVCLFHGVTSSGKTEIYIHLIQDYLRKGLQVLFLLPEIALTTQLTERLLRVFGTQLQVYHSRISDAERVEIWHKQLSGNPCQLIVGVRSSVFLPFQKLGLVIIDEEHEPSYKQQEPAPRYHARSVALILASYFRAHTLLGTATPSFETYYHARTGKYALVNLNTRYADIALPEIHVVDLQELYKKKQMNGPFSPVLLAAIRKALDNKEQVILFQNRRGFAPMMICRECGWVPKCSYCDVSMTYHRRFNLLSCHYCGASAALPAVCPSCRSEVILSRGYGTERIEEEVKRLFPEARVARMDLDTTQSKHAFEQIITSFASGHSDILIGTQMVSKGLDFDRVRVVGILNTDDILNQPDFRSYERAYQMMSQVAGRAGRRKLRGQVFLQTRNPELPVISQVVQHDYLSHYLLQMQERSMFHYPPFCHLIEVHMKYRHEDILEQTAANMALKMRAVFGKRVLGPDAPAVSRVQAMYIRKIILKVEASVSLTKVRKILLSIRQDVLSATVQANVQIYFDVDPL